jgi:hypothetical protein
MNAPDELTDEKPKLQPKCLPPIKFFVDHFHSRAGRLNDVLI